MDKNAVEFLVRAKKATFAGNGTKMESSRPNSKDLQYVEGELKYIDSSFSCNKNYYCMMFSPYTVAEMHHGRK